MRRAEDVAKPWTRRRRDVWPTGAARWQLRTVRAGATGVGAVNRPKAKATQGPCPDVPEALAGPCGRTNTHRALAAAQPSRANGRLWCIRARTRPRRPTPATLGWRHPVDGLACALWPRQSSLTTVRRSGPSTDGRGREFTWLVCVPTRRASSRRPDTCMVRVRWTAGFEAGPALAVATW